MRFDSRCRNLIPVDKINRCPPNKFSGTDLLQNLVESDDDMFAIATRELSIRWNIEKVEFVVNTSVEFFPVCHMKHSVCSIRSSLWGGDVHGGGNQAVMSEGVGDRDVSWKQTAFASHELVDERTASLMIACGKWRMVKTNIDSRR